MSQKRRCGARASKPSKPCTVRFWTTTLSVSVPKARNEAAARPIRQSPRAAASGQGPPRARPLLCTGVVWNSMLALGKIMRFLAEMKSAGASSIYIIHNGTTKFTLLTEKAVFCAGHIWSQSPGGSWRRSSRFRTLHVRIPARRLGRSAGIRPGAAQVHKQVGAIGPCVPVQLYAGPHAYPRRQQSYFVMSSECRRGMS